MEDLVCAKAHDSKRGKIALITWGRVFDVVDEVALKRALVSGLGVKGFRSIKRIEICFSLSEGARERYFFEALFHFAQRPIPFGETTYRRWAAKMRKEISQGRQLFVINGPKTAKPRRK